MRSLGEVTNSLRRTFLGACLLSLALATCAGATPTVTLSWDGGPGVHPNWNRTRAEGSVATVVATATGFDQPVRGIQVRIGVASQYLGMPDAWRFDGAGCAAGGFQAPEVAIDASCPFLSGSNAARYVDVQYQFGREGFLYALIHDPVAVPSGARYTIGQFRFDLGRAFAGLGVKPDSCGCIEQPQGIHLLAASWLGADGVEYPFLVANECLNWEDPANSVLCPFFGCDLCDPNEPPPPANPCAEQKPTPAQATSWGKVKAAYR